MQETMRHPTRSFATSLKMERYDWILSGALSAVFT
jgi:hypothetical protein